MPIISPSTGFEAFALYEWWENTRQFIDQIRKFRYQVELADLATNTGTVNMDLLYDDCGIYVSNPGTITLPTALGHSGKIYYFIANPNSNINAGAGGWNGKNCLLNTQPGETIYSTYTSVKLITGFPANVTSREEFMLLSDGISTWIPF